MNLNHFYRNNVNSEHSIFGSILKHDSGADFESGIKGIFKKKIFIQMKDIIKT